MATTALTAATFEPAVLENDIVLVVFGKVDTEAEHGLAEC